MVMNLCYMDEFPGLVLNYPLPDDWVDLSDGRLMSPHFMDSKSRLHIWFDPAPWRDRIPLKYKFSVSRNDDEISIDIIWATNDWDELITYLEAEHLRRVRSLAG
jgi:hypothetical protein